MNRNRTVLLLGSILLILVIAVIPFIGACSEPVTTPAPSPTPELTPAPTPEPATPAAPSTAPAPAPEPTEVIKLRYYCADAPTVPLTQCGLYFVDQIEERSEGRVEIERLTGGVLGNVSETLGLIRRGSVDLMTFIVTRFPDDFPMNNCIGTPANVGSAERGVDYTNYIYYENPETSAILEQEWTQNNVKYLRCQAGSTYGIMSTIEYSSLADLKDKKIGTHLPRGIYTEPGLVEVKVDIPDMYEALSRGLVDCVQFAVGGMVGLKLYEPGECLLVDGNFPANSGPCVANLEVWNTLPADIQEIINESALAAQQWSIDYQAEALNEIMRTIEDSGVVVGDFPDTDKKNMVELSLALQKAASLEVAEKAGKLNEGQMIWDTCEEYLGITVPYQQ